MKLNFVSSILAAGVLAATAAQAAPAVGNPPDAPNSSDSPAPSAPTAQKKPAKKAKSHQAKRDDSVGTTPGAQNMDRDSAQGISSSGTTAEKTAKDEKSNDIPEQTTGAQGQDPGSVGMGRGMNGSTDPGARVSGVNDKRK